MTGPSRSAESPEGVSVVLPVYNEEAGLAAVLRDVTQSLCDCGCDHEVIVVDDGSTDGTARVLAAAEGVRSIQHTRNRGYGAALKSGIRAARYPLVLIMDADGTYPASEVPALVARCRGADMVVGARTGRLADSSALRGLVKLVFRWFARWITAARIPDLNSGMRVFRREIADRFADVLPDGFSFTTTITVASLSEGLRVEFHPVGYRVRVGRSKIRPVRDTARIARQLVRLGLRFSPLRTAVAFAAPPALLFGILAVRAVVSPELRGPATAYTLLALAALDVLLLGAGLFARRAAGGRGGRP